MIREYSKLGENHHRSKLTDIEVANLLKERFEYGATYNQLARRFGVSKSCVAGICQGRRRGLLQKAEKSKTIDRSSKVRASFTIPLRSRALIHKAGGSDFLMDIADKINSALLSAHGDKENAIIRRVVVRMICS